MLSISAPKQVWLASPDQTSPICLEERWLTNPRAWTDWRFIYLYFLSRRGFNCVKSKRCIILRIRRFFFYGMRGACSESCVRRIAKRSEANSSGWAKARRADKRAIKLPGRVAFSVNHRVTTAQWSTAYFYITRVEYDSSVIQIAEAKPTEIIQKPGRAGNSTGVEARVGRNFRVAFSVPSSEGRPSRPFCFPCREFLPGSQTAASFAGGGSQTLSGSNDASCPEMARVVPGRKCDTYVCERTCTPGRRVRISLARNTNPIAHK